MNRDLEYIWGILFYVLLAGFVLVAAALILVMAGCAHNPAQLRPGAVNTFDQGSFDTLVTVQAALEQSSKEVVAFPALKPELNKAIDGYNVAMVAYKAYHEAVVAGKPADQPALDKLIRDLSAAVASIVQKLKPSAPLKPVASLEWRFA